MTIEEHKEIHERLHQALDELSADFIYQTGKGPSDSSILDLMKWSDEQRKNPTKKGVRK